MGDSIQQLIVEYALQIKAINHQLKELAESNEQNSYKQIKVLKSMKKDLKYSISLMKKHQ